MAAKTLTIDGKHVSATDGATIVEAASDAGIAIPTPSPISELNDVGACRLCLVEVAGVPKLLSLELLLPDSNGRTGVQKCPSPAKKVEAS